MSAWERHEGVPQSQLSGYLKWPSVSTTPTLHDWRKHETYLDGAEDTPRGTVRRDEGK